MTEREVKNENPFKDHILEKLLGKRNSDSKEGGIVANKSKNQKSFFPQNSARKPKEDLKETDSAIGIENSKNSTASGYLMDNGEMYELTEIPEKSKRSFKSMTIDRMGKMLKFKSSASSQCESEPRNNERNENAETRTNFHPDDHSSPKGKTNSLGRVFKLMDKDMNPSRIFGSSTSKSSKSTRKTNNYSDDDKYKDDRIRRAFSKMLSQIKGRKKSEKTAAEPNLRTAVEEKSKDSHPATPRTALASRIISSLSSSPSRLSAVKKSTPLTHDPTSSTSGIP